MGIKLKAEYNSVPEFLDAITDFSCLTTELTRNGEYSFQVSPVRSPLTNSDALDALQKFLNTPGFQELYKVWEENTVASDTKVRLPENLFQHEFAGVSPLVGGGTFKKSSSVDSVDDSTPGVTPAVSANKFNPGQ